MEGEAAFRGRKAALKAGEGPSARTYGKDKFLLSNRGFHWINEMPYNQFGPRDRAAAEDSAAAETAVAVILLSSGPLTPS